MLFRPIHDRFRAVSLLPPLMLPGIGFSRIHGRQTLFSKLWHSTTLGMAANKMFSFEEAGSHTTITSAAILISLHTPCAPASNIYTKKRFVAHYPYSALCDL